MFLQAPGFCLVILKSSFHIYFESTDAVVIGMGEVQQQGTPGQNYSVSGAQVLLFAV